MRLWLEGKVTMSELEHLSLADVEQLNRALDSWQEAEYRASKRGAK